MQRLQLLGLVVAGMLLSAGSNVVTVARADFPAADLSTSLLFHCLPDSTVRAELKWTNYNQGVQWLDLSLFNNDFAPGTFQGIGPLPPTQSGLAWDSLTPGVWYFARVNTLTFAGWSPSRQMAFITPPDCFSPAAASAYYPPPPPTQCLNLAASAGSVVGCVWTAKADYQTYALGEPVVYCYSVSQSTDVRIVATRPDGSNLLVADRFDPGTGACVGPYQANYPVGLRSVAMYGGPSFLPLSTTHFYVR